MYEIQSESDVFADRYSRASASCFAGKGVDDVFSVSAYGYLVSGGEPFVSLRNGDVVYFNKTCKAIFLYNR